MNAQLARKVADRMIESGYVKNEEWSARRAVLGGEDWAIYIRGEHGAIVIRTPEDWTRIASERGAARDEARA